MKGILNPLKTCFAAVVLGCALIAPTAAHAWWRGGVYVGVPPVIVGPPVYYYPRPVIYGPPPVYVVPRPYWVPAHYDLRGFWVPGHWV